MASRIVNVRIYGSVQRVGFRKWAERQAFAAGLEGWVRNRLDGSVECLFCGSEQAVADAIDLCRHGPPRASIERIEERAAGADELGLRSAGARFDVLATI